MITQAKTIEIGFNPKLEKGHILLKVKPSTIPQNWNFPSISPMWTIWFPRSCPFPVSVWPFLLLLILLLLLLVCVPFIYSESLELGTPTPQKLLNGLFLPLGIIFWLRAWYVLPLLCGTPWFHSWAIPTKTSKLQWQPTEDEFMVSSLNSLSAISGPKLVGTCPSEF